MPLQHGEFIKYMQRLGYRSNSTGICFGLAHMGLQAILSEDFESFKKHLEDIEEDIANNYKLGDLISEEDIRKMDGVTKDEIQKLTDIRAFCDGVELYFQPQYYKDVFQEDARALSQDAMKTSPLIDSIKMTEQQGLYQAASFSGVYEEQELLDLLKLLKEKIPNEYNKPIALEVSFIGHSICVGYIPNTKKWVFIDANDLPPKQLNEEAIARKIKRSFRSTEKIILTGKIYSTKNNKDEVNNIILGWKNDKTYERIQIVTPEKARYANNDKQTWLHHSARVGDLPLTQDLLEKGANINARRSDGATALMFGSGSGHLDVVNALIAKGADTDLRNANGFTPLMLASYNGDFGVVSALIAKDKNIDAINANGWTALMFAAGNGHVDVVNALIAKGANVDLGNAEGKTAFMLAAELGRLEVVNALIAKGANIDAIDADGWTALMFAAGNGHLDVVNALIAKGANIDAIDANGWTPLMLAAKNGHFEVVNALIENSANINVIDADGQTPLMQASYDGHVEVVNALIAKGANIDAIDADGWTALMFAAGNGHLGVVNTLIAKGACVDKGDDTGWTPLMFAAKSGHFEVVRVLIAKGANVHMKDKDGNSALTLASPELREAMLKQIATQNEPALRKKLTFSDSRGEEADSNTSSTVLQKIPTSKP